MYCVAQLDLLFEGGGGVLFIFGKVRDEGKCWGCVGLVNSYV